MGLFFGPGLYRAHLRIHLFTLDEGMIIPEELRLFLSRVKILPLIPDEEFDDANTRWFHDGAQTVRKIKETTKGFKVLEISTEINKDLKHASFIQKCSFVKKEESWKIWKDASELELKKGAWSF